MEPYGTLLLSEPQGTEILIDHAFVGTIPAKRKLTAGRHTIAVKKQHHADWIRSVDVLQDSEVTLNRQFE